ncbi:RNase H domain-containing protein [Trichonephila clavipes]|nr:RNase H domain-containing protein [Trichonephila clavipes]
MLSGHGIVQSGPAQQLNNSDEYYPKDDDPRHFSNFHFSRKLNNEETQHHRCLNRRLSLRIICPNLEYLGILLLTTNLTLDSKWSSVKREYVVLSIFFVENVDSHSRLYSKGFDIVFCWLPSHVGNIGNEQADSAAKSATTHLPLAVPLSDIKRVIMHHIFQLWQESWSQQLDNKLHSVKPVIGAWPVMPMRRTDVQLTRLRIGYTRFTHRHLLLGEDAPACPSCKAVTPKCLVLPPVDVIDLMPTPAIDHHYSFNQKTAVGGAGLFKSGSKRIDKLDSENACLTLGIEVWRMCWLLRNPRNLTIVRNYGVAMGGRSKLFSGPGHRRYTDPLGTGIRLSPVYLRLYGALSAQSMNLHWVAVV